MPILIRRAVPEDCSGLLSLLEQIARHHHLLRPKLYKNNGAKYNKKDLLQFFSNPDTPILTAVSGETILGYAFCRIQRTKDDILLQDRTVLYLDDLCVEETMRGNGLGTMLFDAVKALASQQKCDAIELNVLEENISAVLFYRSKGMKTQKRRMELPMNE